MKTSLAGLICLLVMTSGSAFAKTKEVTPSGQEQILTIAVPQSEIKLAPVLAPSESSVDVEVSVSGYEPANFTRGSYNGRVAQFKKSGGPLVSLNRVGELYAFDSGLSLSSIIGFSYLCLERQASGPAVSVGAKDENMNVIMGRMGLQSFLPRILPWGIQPIVSIRVLPTWITADQSAYEKSVGAFGLLLEATAGILWRFIKQGSIGVSAQTISGSIDGSSLKGTGIQG